MEGVGGKGGRVGGGRREGLGVDGWKGWGWMGGGWGVWMDSWGLGVGVDRRWGVWVGEGCK